MLRYILVLLFVTQVIVGIPQKRSCEDSRCGKLYSHESGSWDSIEDSSDEDKKYAVDCKHTRDSDSSSSSEELTLRISDEDRDWVPGYKYYMLRKRVETKYDVAIACENTKLQIVCPYNHIIKVIYANYGRTCNKYCMDPTKGNVTVTDCMCISAYDVVSWYCTDANSCFLPANNNVFVDICPGVYKYLEVVYACVPIQQCVDPVNQRFTTCTPCDPVTCRNKNDFSILTPHCVPGCVCTGNTVLAYPDGPCVAKDMCPFYNPAHPGCTGNEVFSPNATKCQPSCDNGGIPQNPCPYPPQNGYVCEEGRVRNRDGRCVEPCACPCDSLIRQQ